MSRQLDWKGWFLSSRKYCFYLGSSAGKESSCNAGDSGLISGLGRSPEEGIGYSLQYSWASLVAQRVKNPPAMQETRVQSLGWEDPLEEGLATYSSILAWRISMHRRAWWVTVHWVANYWATKHTLPRPSTLREASNKGESPAFLQGAWKPTLWGCRPRPAGLCRCWLSAPETSRVTFFSQKTCTSSIC